jgi:hypothetical protein
VSGRAGGKQVVDAGLQMRWLLEMHTAENLSQQLRRNPMGVAGIFLGDGNEPAKLSDIGEFLDQEYLLTGIEDSSRAAWAIYDKVDETIAVIMDPKKKVRLNDFKMELSEAEGKLKAKYSRRAVLLFVEGVNVHQQVDVIAKANRKGRDQAAGQVTALLKACSTPLVRFALENPGKVYHYRQTDSFYVYILVPDDTTSLMSLLYNALNAALHVTVESKTIYEASKAMKKIRKNKPGISVAAHVGSVCMLKGDLTPGHLHEVLFESSYILKFMRPNQVCLSSTFRELLGDIKGSNYRAKEHHVKCFGEPMTIFELYPFGRRPRGLKRYEIN